MGDTLTVPATAPPVEKLLPVHDVLLVEPQVRVELLPLVILAGEADRDAVGVEMGVEVVPPVVYVTLSDGLIEPSRE